jgi:hypothetical protein
VASLGSAQGHMVGKCLDLGAVPGYPMVTDLEYLCQKQIDHGKECANLYFLKGVK